MGDNSSTGGTTTQLNNILTKQMNMTQLQDQDDQKTGQAWTADDLPAAPGCSWELKQNNNMAPNLLYCSNQASAAGSIGLHQPINNLSAIDHHQNMLNFNSTTTTTTAFNYPSDPQYCFI